MSGRPWSPYRRWVRIYMIGHRQSSLEDGDKEVHPLEPLWKVRAKEEQGCLLRPFTTATNPDSHPIGTALTHGKKVRREGERRKRKKVGKEPSKFRRSRGCSPRIQATSLVSVSLPHRRRSLVWGGHWWEERLRTNSPESARREFQTRTTHCSKGSGCTSWYLSFSSWAACHSGWGRSSHMDLESRHFTKLRSIHGNWQI